MDQRWQGREWFVVRKVTPSEALAAIPQGSRCRGPPDGVVHAVSQPVHVQQLCSLALTKAKT
eukprot:128500-Alexandrium_andersonii.AAC.1